MKLTFINIKEGSFARNRVAVFNESIFKNMPREAINTKLIDRILTLAPEN